MTTIDTTLAKISRPNLLIEEHLKALSHLNKTHWWHQHRFSLAMHHLSHTTGDFLDYGCGTGDFLKKIAITHPKKWTLFGFDPSTTVDSLDKVPSFAFHSSLPKNKKYDVISALDILEHFEDDKQALQDIRSHCHANTSVFFTVPALKAFWSGRDNSLGHFRRYSLEELTAKVEEAGFQVDQASYFFSFLCLPALYRRCTFKPNTAQDATLLEFAPLPKWLNTILLKIGTLERFWLRLFKLPIGTSIYLKARLK